MEFSKSKPLSYFIFVPLLFLVFIRPFFSGLAYPHIELYFQNSLIFLAILTLIVEVKRFEIFPRNYDNFPVLFLLAAYAISCSASSDIQNSLAETIKFVSFAAIFFIVSQCSGAQKTKLIKVIVTAASIISLYSVYQYFWGYQRTLDYLEKIHSDFLVTSSYARDILIAKRAIGTFPSPNILGGYLIITFFLALQICRESSRRKLWYLAPLLISAALLFTKSMGAWLSLIFALIVLFMLSYNSVKQHKLKLALCIIFIIAALGFILVTRWERLMNLENPQNSITQRLNYWRTALAVIKAHPILGVGPGNFQEVFLTYKIGLSTNTRYAHNIFLHMWAEAGLLGFLGIVYLTADFLKKLKTQPENTFIFLGGLAFILHNIIDNTYFIPEAGLFLWILLGMLRKSKVILSDL